MLGSDRGKALQQQERARREEQPATDDDTNYPVAYSSDHGGDSDSDASRGHQSRSHDRRDADQLSASSGSLGAAAPLGHMHRGDRVSWETNNLFDYLKGLHMAGEQQEISEEWVSRLSSLRRLLLEREAEIEQLQQLLEEQHGQLQAREEALEAQASRIDALEVRIHQLLSHIDALATRHSGSHAERHMVASYGAAAGELPLTASQALLKRQLSAAAYQPAPNVQQHSQNGATADSCLVQLPAQSYAAYQGCGFWQAVLDTFQCHPRRIAACTAALALLLIIVLCATLVPAAQRRRSQPRFLAAPTVVASGGTWVDVSVQLDRPSVLSWMAFKQADLGTQVPGLQRTLLQLIQDRDLEPQAVHAASSAAASMCAASAASSQLSGLQQLAVACGWAPVTNASGSSTVSLLSASEGGASSACSSTGSGLFTADRCARCPLLEGSTAYTLLLVATTARGVVGSSAQLVNAVTADSEVSSSSLEPPYAGNATATSFDLRFKLRAPGRLYYVVAHQQLFAAYGDRRLAFGALAPSSRAVLAANPAAFLGGLVANGSVAVPAGGQWTSLTVQPPCVAALCKQSLHGLQGGTAYTVFLVAVDYSGAVDAVPTAANMTTAPVEAPALLPATAPTNITASAFGMSISMEAAGGVYYLLVAAKPGASAAANSADVAAGSWARLQSLVPDESSSRRLLAAGSRAGTPASSHPGGSSAAARQRLLVADVPVQPGSLMASSCSAANQSCALAPAAAFDSIPELASTFDTVRSGCLVVPAAGKAVTLPAFSGLQNNTVYLLLLATEESNVQQPAPRAPPVVFAVHTVDLSAPQLACGFPIAANITSSSFSLAAMLNKPGATAAYVVLLGTAALTAPTAQEVLQGTGAGGAAVAAAGSLSTSGWLPWEAFPAAGQARDARKMWAEVTGLQGGSNYTAFIALTENGDTPLPGSHVTALRDVLTPAVLAPTFTSITGFNASVDEQNGTFSLQLATGLDRAGRVHYALYRSYSCIQREPSIATIVAGTPLPPAICRCDDQAYCAPVTTGSYEVPAQALSALHAIGGDLSPLPFQSLRNTSEEQLKCFQGGLGQATDTYNIYLVADSALPSQTGLAPQCGSFSQAAATAATAAALPTADVAASCPAALQLSCAQAQLRADSPVLQSGSMLTWPLNTSSSSGTLEWLRPAGPSAARQPAKVQLSLEGGAAPAFLWGPTFPAELRTASSIGMQFALDKPALLIYAVFAPMPIDASGSPQAPVLVATGRVPVFQAGANATSGAIAACPWAPGGALQLQSQYYVTFVARDKYGRMDGLCPGQLAGATPRVCTDIAFTGG